MFIIINEANTEIQSNKLFQKMNFKSHFIYLTVYRLNLKQYFEL